MQSDKVVDYIVNWLKNYAQKNKMNGFVIGLSGGIDSALTSTLCAKTGLNVLCVEMPIHQEKKQVDRAEKHIAWLKANFPNFKNEEVELTSVFDELVNAFPKVENEEDRFMAFANTRARLRMTSLYYFAGLKKLLVAGTGNKVEDFGIGFFTKYGDGGVDLNPIADLYKTEVYELAEYLKIDKSILNAKPTDGLWGDDRSDEDQIGASYPELEWAMEQEKLNKTSDDFEGRKLDVFKIYKHRNRINQHKLQPIPVCEIPVGLKK